LNLKGISGKKSRTCRTLTFDSQRGWEQINEAEISAGEAQGKPRVKITDIQEMLGFAGLLRP